MLAVDVPAEQRVTTVVVIATWVALAVGIFTSVATGITDINAALAGSGSGALWVLAITVLPHAAIRRPLVLEGVTLFGVATTIVAVALTGTVDSQFLLLSVTPTMYAAIHGGFRVGLGTAGLSALLLAVVTFAQEGEVLPAVGNMALYLAVGATIAQVRRLLLDVQRRSAALERSSLQSEQRLQSLEGAHALLARLADITGSADTSPMAIARSALEMVCDSYPDSAAVAAINGEEGPIMVAKQGMAPEPSIDSVVPLAVGGAEVGHVTVRTARALTRAEIEGLETSLRPLALAFSNARLLQNITGSAVKAERVRLARELHDEIGPSLASLGLALDLALVQSASQSELTGHIEQLRSRVTDLVDEVRATVSDLRTGKATTLKVAVDRLLADTGTDLEVSFEVDERRPVRPSLNEAVLGITGEALRNAILHSGAKTVRLSGWIDFDRGKLVIEDDGHGFDPSDLPKGHFGVLGMRERAADAGLALDLTSGSNGTRVLIEWS
jgi:signal transduction histidine kinase